MEQMEHEKTLIHYNVLKKHLTKEDAIENKVDIPKDQIASTSVEFDMIKDSDSFKQFQNTTSIEFGEKHMLGNFEFEFNGVDETKFDEKITLKSPKIMEMDKASIKSICVSIDDEIELDLDQYKNKSYFFEAKMSGDLIQSDELKKICISNPAVNSVGIKEVKIDSSKVEISCPSINSSINDFAVNPINSEGKLYKNRDIILEKYIFPVSANVSSDCAKKIEFDSLLEDDMSFKGNFSNDDSNSCTMPLINLETDYISKKVVLDGNPAMDVKLHDMIDLINLNPFIIEELKGNTIIAVNTDDKILVLDNYSEKGFSYNPKALELANSNFDICIKDSINPINLISDFSIRILDSTNCDELVANAVEKISEEIELIQEMMGAYISLEE